ncbi:hypothetical protein ACFVAJ_16300 [Agromyces sp. NPDC057679]|uniref:hypothetical protein n=1 Tax=Agromyces sp. NPDC057679 TaxID=3346207 RepID=UPI0036700AC9
MQRMTQHSAGSTMSSAHMLSARSAAEISFRLLSLGDESMALRMIVQSLDHFRHAGTPELIADFLVEPGSTGDIRWDALLAGAVAWTAKDLGHPAPAWTDVPPLEEEWVPLCEGAGDAYLNLLRRDAEPDLMKRNIVMGAKDMLCA